MVQHIDDAERERRPPTATNSEIAAPNQTWGQLKNFRELLKRRYNSDDEVKAATKEWSSGIGRIFFAGGLENLVPRLQILK
ncbi:hypothetical protein NPIL_53081 [Nephila pilipes]|uniref:Uncharacterized protein n=1 Tax=Nephila pilipes TaxID=299642 RepID=A0A8X6R9I9_NEPPI|nr:hypothetical protein NPIL_53081 [Nephila pilipes]